MRRRRRRREEEVVGAVGQPKKKKRKYCRVQILVFRLTHIRNSSQEALLCETDKIRPDARAGGKKREKKNSLLRAAEAFYGSG